jgi:hypothetical protein
MYLVFFDESGFTPDWKAGMGQQPFYSLAAVCIDAARLRTAYDGLRADVAALGLPEATAPLGRGHEIKAKDIASGSGWWHSHTEQRNSFRELMLGFPAKYGGVAVLVVIDKARHNAKYFFPDNPYLLALRYALERVATWLAAKNETGVVIYDQNKRLEGELHSEANTLIRDGSDVSYVSRWFGGEVSFSVSLDSILEFTLGNSANSLGLQVADYFATFGYQYFKGDKPSPCEWWETLLSGLRRENGEVEGYGLKTFP